MKNQGLGLINAGWGADFPTPYGMFQNIVNGNAILPQGNSNYASINIPAVNKVLDDTGNPLHAGVGRSPEPRPHGVGAVPANSATARTSGTATPA